ncbi:MAG: ABC transporter permease, partial [Clostridiales bacterium]|nr:ABC transporter permease [Clostridiales bacterium]
MSKGRRILKDQRLLLLIIIVVLSATVGIINPRFVRLNNIMAILQQISVLGVLTMAMSMLLISGGIDLSIGNMMTLSGVVVATLLMRGANLLVAVLAGMGVSTLCGLLNG